MVGRVVQNISFVVVVLIVVVVAAAAEFCVAGICKLLLASLLKSCSQPATAPVLEYLTASNSFKF